MKSSRALLGLFEGMAVLIVVSTLVMYWFGRQVIDAHRVADKRRASIGQAELVLSSLKDAEIGQRGFLLTGDESYLQPYETALRQLPQQLNRLTGGPRSVMNADCFRVI